MRVRPILEIVIKLTPTALPTAFEHHVLEYMVNKVSNLSLAHPVLIPPCLLTSTGLGGILSLITNFFETITLTRMHGALHA